VLAAGGYITEYQTEIFSSFHRAKATGYFLLNLGHRNIVRAEVIGEWNFEYHREAQYIMLKLAQPLEPVSRFGSFDWAALADCSFLFIGWWGFDIPFHQNAPVSTPVILALLG
jgi:hypothetical protein